MGLVSGDGAFYAVMARSPDASFSNARTLMTMEGQVLRVVVVDDHALLRDGTRRILEAHPDLQVVGETDSGEVALALVNQLHPDVVLMDIALPGMNGIEVTRRLTQDHPAVRVLMVSACDEDEYVRSAVEAGAAGYLSKTAPGDELVQAVRAVAGGTSVLQSDLMGSTVQPATPAGAGCGRPERHVSLRS